MTQAIDQLAGTLLPGDGRWPNAADLGLATTITEIAALRDASATALLRFTNSPPAGLFGDPDEQVGAVRTMERERMVEFGLLRALVYEAYYRDARVQSIIAERSGWRMGPPQPQGYLEVFRHDPPPDLSGVLARGVRWRHDGTDTARAVRAEQENHPTRTWTEEEIKAWRQ